MRSIRFVALSALLTVGTISAVLYSSCTKDACKGVTCQNTGTCSGGTCTCPSGVGGFSCETVYRTNYTNTYKGNGSATGAADTLSYANSSMTFGASDTVLTKMSLSLQTNANAGLPSTYTVVLANNTATGSTFTIQPATVDSFTFTGTGTVTPSTASMTIVKTKVTGTSTTFTFSSMTKQ